MSDTFGTIKTKLLWKLLAVVVFSGMIALASSYGLAQVGYYYVENTFDSQEMNRSFQLKYMDDLQRYVEEHEITVDNIYALEQWADDNSYVYFSIYQNNNVIFNSDYIYSNLSDTFEEGVEENVANPDEMDVNRIEDMDGVNGQAIGSEDSSRESDGNEDAEGYEEADEDDAEYDDLMELSDVNAEYFYQLILSDGTLVSVDMFCYDYFNYNNYVLLASIAVGMLLFVTIFTRCISKKLSYIKQLERELQILEGGNLEYPVTVKGNDEIGSLARGIDQMRLSIIEKNSKEQQVLEANRNLVTAMSHDLRTPLTTLTGYMEILNMGKVTDEEKRRHYLALSLEKTREIKELSDELFEYFLAYNEEQKRLEMEPVPAYGLVADLIENQFLNLEEKGYVISGTNEVDENAGNCMINPQFMHRVLNNILSNLEKYADMDKPVEVTAELEKDKLMVLFRNAIKKNIDAHESTKIGLITCERIMKLHHGDFRAYESEGEFVVKLSIPMEQVMP